MEIGTAFHSGTGFVALDKDELPTSFQRLCRKYFALPDPPLGPTETTEAKSRLLFHGESVCFSRCRCWQRGTGDTESRSRIHPPQPSFRERNAFLVVYMGLRKFVIGRPCLFVIISERDRSACRQYPWQQIPVRQKRHRFIPFSRKRSSTWWKKSVTIA